MPSFLPMSLPLSPTSTRRARRAGGFTLVELLTVITIIGILASILVPVVGTAIFNAKRQKTYVQLNNLAQAVQLYKDQYRVYPTLTTSVPTADFPLGLKNYGQRFLNIMTGHPGGDDLRFNKKAMTFFSASDSDLTPDGLQIVDAFGNNDIYIIMDTDGDGIIKAASIAGVNMTSADGKNIHIPQTKDVHANVVVMSPGRGLADSDAVTTFDVR